MKTCNLHTCVLKIYNNVNLSIMLEYITFSLLTQKSDKLFYKE